MARRGGGECGVGVGVRVGWGGGESELCKMFTILKMVITGIENWSPDMIPVAFERKFDENLNEIPPGIIDII